MCVCGGAFVMVSKATRSKVIFKGEAKKESGGRDGCSAQRLLMMMVMKITLLVIPGKLDQFFMREYHSDSSR